MKQNKITVTVIVIAIILMGVVGYSVLSRTPSKIPPIKGWSVFSSGNNKFEVKYPPGWKVIDTGEFEGEEYIVIRSPAPDIDLYADVRSSKRYSTLDAFLKEVDKIQAVAYEGTPSVEVLKEYKTTVDGHNAVQREERLIAAGFPAVTTYIFKDGTIFSVSSRFVGDPRITPENLATHNMVLSTFKFVK